MEHENENLLSETANNHIKEKVKLGLSINGSRKRLHLGKDVLRVMGLPTYIGIKVNRQYDSFYFEPCDKKEILSFKVPENLVLNGRAQMEFVSLEFVERLFFLNGLSLDKTYFLEGKYAPAKNAVVFFMADAREEK